MPPEYVKAACDAAHELGLKVAAHVESPEGVKCALANGVDSIEHGAAARRGNDRVIQRTSCLPDCDDFSGTAVCEI